MPARLPTFWIKLGLLTVLVAGGDVLFWRTKGMGLNLGLFGLVLTLAVVVAEPAIRRTRLGVAALGLAGVLGALQVERATALAWLGFLAALAVAALSPRAPEGQDGWRWFQRLVAAGVKGLFGPVLDLRDVLRRGAGEARRAWPRSSRARSCRWSAASCSSCCSWRPIR